LHRVDLELASGRNAAGIYLHRVDDTSSLLESLQKTSEGFHWRVAEVLSEAPLGSYWGLAGVSLGARWGLAGGSLGARWGLAEHSRPQEKAPE
jgi:hypothetical protein